MLAIGWAFARECWGLSRAIWAMTLGYLLALVLLVHACPAETFEPVALIFLTFPIWAQAIVLIAVFSHGETADLLARESGYPRRTFTLPVRDRTLIGWPMAIGASSLALCWVLLDVLVLWPAGAEAPLAWPAVFAAAVVVWAQALTWCPFPLVALRIFVMLPILGGLGIGAALGVAYHVPPPWLLAGSAGLIPPAYLVALAGLSRARRGDGAVWHWPILERTSTALSTAAPFASAADAMYWLDLGRNRLGLPLFFGMFLGPILLTLIIFNQARLPVVSSAAFLHVFVLFPPLLTAATSAVLGVTSHWGVGSYELRPFYAARPVTSAEMIRVKLRVGARILARTWMAALLLLAIALPFTQVGPMLLDWTRQLIEAYGVGLIVAGILALAMFNARSMVDYLFIGLYGRVWVLPAFWSAVGVGTIGVGLIVKQPDWHEHLLGLVPWAIGAALAAKVIAGAVVGWLLARHELVARHTLQWYAGGWVMAALVLVGLALWLTPPELASPVVVAMAAVLLLLPLVRLGLAPLALDWNRHR
jgi:hypothetical protein